MQQLEEHASPMQYSKSTSFDTPADLPVAVMPSAFNSVVHGSQNVPLKQSTPAYLRSRIFTPHAGINPLLASSATLLSLVSRLREQPDFSDAFNMQQQLLHELQVFEALAADKGCNAETIRIARYILCITIDEILMNAIWQGENIWEHEGLLSRFEPEDKQAHDYLFKMVEQLIEQPQRHIDLLELIYVYLSLGYEGHAPHYKVNDKKYLDEMIDKLYYVISEVRDEKRIEKIPFLIHGEETRPSLRLPFLSLVLSITLLTSVYSIFQYTLAVRSAPLAQTLQHVLQNIQSIAL